MKREIGRFRAGITFAVVLVSLAALCGFAQAQPTETKITASDASALDQFGWAVAISGNRALVGAPDDGDVLPKSGAAYVFEFDGAAWVEAAKLTASDADADDYFGRAVAISGDRALVGNGMDDGVGINSGSAYVFEYDGTSWVEVAKLTASDAKAKAQFGFSVAIAGDRALIGAKSDTDVGGGNSGSAYVFEFNGVTWSEVQKLTASDAQKNDGYGFSVDISGDRFLIGALGEDSGGHNSGSAYVYELDGVSWVEVAKLTASDPAADDLFGFSVAISGNRALVGSPEYRRRHDPGSAYLFEFDGTTWVETAKLTAGDATDDDRFGFSVALSADRAFVGAPLDDDDGTESGSAYLYALNQSPDVSQAYADPGQLWPPNGKLHAISLEGVTDPDGDEVAIVITAITADEAIGDDEIGGIETATAVVAAARDGKGDGRAYTISFVASDNEGGTSEGNVVVVVPHDQGHRKAKGLKKPALSIYLNPANPGTNIAYTLIDESGVAITVYNVLGQEIRRLVDETKGPGSYNVHWGGTDAQGRAVTSGLYLIRYELGDVEIVRKFVRVK